MGTRPSFTWRRVIPSGSGHAASLIASIPPVTATVACSTSCQRQHIKPTCPYSCSVSEEATPTEWICVHSPTQRDSIIDVGDNGRLVDDDSEADGLSST